MKVLKKMSLIIIIISMLFSCVPVGVSAERGPNYDKDVEIGEVAINMLNRRANHRFGGERYASHRLGELNDARRRGGEVREKTLADIGSRIRVHLENVGLDTEEYFDTAVYKIGPELKDAVALIFSRLFSEKDEIVEEVIYDEGKGYEGFRYFGEIDEDTRFSAIFKSDPALYASDRYQKMEEAIEFYGPGELVLVFDLISPNLPLEHLGQFSFTRGSAENLYGPHGSFSHRAEVVEYEQLSESSFVLHLDYSENIPLRNFPFEARGVQFSVSPSSYFVPQDSHYEIYYKVIDVDSERPEIAEYTSVSISKFIHDDYKDVLTSDDSTEDIYYTIYQYLNEEYPDDLILDHSKDEDGYSPGSFEDYNIPPYQMPTFEPKDKPGLLDGWFDGWFSKDKDKEKDENDMSKSEINSFAENILPDNFPNMQIALSELENVNNEAPVIHLNVYSLFDETTKHVNPELASMIPFDDEDTELFDFAMLDRFSVGGVPIVSYVRMIIGFGFVFVTFRHLWNKIMGIF